MLSTISTARMSDLIGMVYDCVADPEKWVEAIQAIRQDIGFEGGVLGVYDSSSGKPLLQYQSGVDFEWLGRMKEYGRDMIEYWGGPGRIEAYAIDEPVSHSIAGKGVDINANRFHREWIRPQKICDLVAIRLTGKGNATGTIVFTRHDDIGVASEYDLANLRSISPHLRRAVTISGLFDHKAIVASSFSAALDALSLGIVLVDQSARIIHANLAGEEMLKSADPIRQLQGRVTLADSVATSALTDAIAKAALGDLALESRGLGIAVKRRDGSVAVIHVLPLRRGELRSGIQARVVAALFITPTLAPPQSPIEGFGVLKGLTPAETKVFEMVIKGMKVGEIATMLSVASSTVRTHLLRVFEKTGTSRQADLVRMAASLALPV